MTHKNISIVIPVYQEEKVIRKVIQELIGYHYTHIIVVDDGSTDNTYFEAKKEKVLVLRHWINRGKGAALKTGIEAGKLLDADIIVTFDGDGQHDPHDIAKLLLYLQKGYEIVLGSRFLKHQHIPFIKRLYNGIANSIAYVLYGVWVTDSQSGLRAYAKSAFMVFDTKSDRYEFDTEVIRDIKHKKFRHIEIPMHVRYTKYSQEKGTKQNFWSGIQTFLRIMTNA